MYYDLAKVVKQEFDNQNKSSGKTVTIKLFDDFVAPDTALQEGSININFYQHGVYLDQYNKQNGTSLTAVDPKGVLTFYMGIYSNSLKSLDDLKDGATVLIPNDAANRGRALKTLQANGLLKLKSADVPTILDITDNPKDLKLVETDVLKEVKSLDDADAAVINSITATQGGLDPTQSLGKEDSSESGKYSIIVAYKGGDEENRENAKLFTSAIKTDAVKQELEKEFKGAVVPQW